MDEDWPVFRGNWRGKKYRPIRKFGRKKAEEWGRLIVQACPEVFEGCSDQDIFVSVSTTMITIVPASSTPSAELFDVLAMLVDRLTVFDTFSVRVSKPSAHSTSRARILLYSMFGKELQQDLPGDCSCRSTSAGESPSATSVGAA